MTVQPEANTVYRWSFAGTWSFDGSVSEPFTVDVATAVTATTERVPDSDASSPPAASPRPSRAFARRCGGSPGEPRRWWARPRSPTDGSYRIEVPDAPRTFSRYVVTVPAVSGNLAGTSALQTGAGPPLSTLDDASARLNAERDVIATRLAGLRGDFAGVVQASRDSNADDEHDVEGRDDRLRAFAGRLADPAGRGAPRPDRRGPRAGRGGDVRRLRLLRPADPGRSPRGPAERADLRGLRREVKSQV